MGVNTEIIIIIVNILAHLVVFTWRRSVWGSDQGRNSRRHDEQLKRFEYQKTEQLKRFEYQKTDLTNTR